MTDLHGLPLSRRAIVALKSYFGPNERVLKRFTLFCRRLLEVCQRLFSAKADLYNAPLCFINICYSCPLGDQPSQGKGPGNEIAR